MIYKRTDIHPLNRLDVIDKILLMVSVNGKSGCWEWTGARSPRGYGHIRLGGRYETTHRAMLHTVCQRGHDGDHVMHLCDNPSCCRPSHLSSGSHSDNMSDMCAKGRHGSVKYDRETVAGAISSRISGESFGSIARRLGASTETVFSWVNGTKRKHDLSSNMGGSK